MVCSNCHKEIHYPHLNKENIEKLLLEFNTPNKSLLDKKHKTTICKKCGKEFKYVKGKIYCSDECREADKNYPSKDEIIEQYNILGSWRKVADYFSITRKILYKIRNK